MARCAGWRDRAWVFKDEAGKPLRLIGVNIDITDRKRAEEELRESEQRLRLLVEAVEDYAIFTLDPEGRIVTWNTGAQRTTGWTADEVLGRHFSMFYPPEAVAEGLPQRTLERAAAEGRSWEEGLRVRKDGSQYWADVLIAPLRDAQGHPRGFVKVARDVTERKAGP